MAVPKKKVSKSRKRIRRQHSFKITMPVLCECPHCHEKKPAFKVCPNCGYYDGVEIIKKEA